MPFQSTHPARGATFNLGHNFGLLYVISIHAPREGCDPTAGRGRYLRDNFNPRTPRGVRPMSSLSRSRASLHFNPRTPRGVRPVPSPTGWASLKFQSTHPARGATCKLGGGRKMTPNISIHAPREGCDRLLWMLLLPTQISIHAPREGCDGQRVCIWGYPKDFNPRTPRGVRPSATRPAIIPFSISIHAPREGCDVI